MNQDRPPAEIWFAEEWTALLGRVLESLPGEAPRPASRVSAGGAAWNAAVQEIAAKHGAFLWWRQSIPLPGEPVVWIGAARGAWWRIAGRTPLAPGEGDASEARKTYLEILRQSCAELARSASRRWNRDVAPAEGTEESEPPADAKFCQVEVVYPDAALPPILVALAGALQELPEEAEPPELRRTPDVSGDLPSSGRYKTFDLLLGVELPVSVSFGRIQIPLKDVLKLTAGSIIELNRTVDEAVEVIVNNCVVARGEVVVVDGNYGVRIQEIMSRQQRLESLQ